jgi:hypothetical protein|tara:strand:- start:226 stop:741 length:516 start_codon:yes stop_codon:yes gene_type:complete
MATWTAQILVGNSHPNHGGITAGYQLFLSENDRPCWECFPIFPPRLGEVLKNEGHTVWIPPGPGSILECGLLMVALHCFDPMARLPVNKELVSSAKSMSKKIMDKFVDMSILTDKQFKELYDMAKKIKINDSTKLIVTVLAGSSITGQIKELKKHKYDFEVCFSDLITGNQ